MVLGTISYFKRVLESHVYSTQKKAKKFNTCIPNIEAEKAKTHNTMPQTNIKIPTKHYDNHTSMHKKICRYC